MGRKRTGSPVLKGGLWYAQVTVDSVGGGTEIKNFPLAARTKDQARIEASVVAKRVKGKVFEPGKPIKLMGSGITFDVYLERWIESRRLLGYTTVDKDLQRLTDYVLPWLTGKSMLEIERDPSLLRDVINGLEMRVALAASGTDPEVKRFSRSTACKVWEACTGLFGAAAGSNDRELRVLKTNPTKGLTRPKKALRAKEKQWLFPREFARLIANTDAPLAWREAYAVATYLFLRVAELRALQCEDIDLASGMVRVHRGTKKDSVRHFRMEPEIVPLVRLLMERVGGKGRIFRLLVARHAAVGRAAQTEAIGTGKQAHRLREHLRSAGVTREALHRSTRQSINITFHDLRATGITWLALRGEPMISIRDRAGHTDVEQTDAYVRRVSQVGDVGAPFPSLTALYCPPGQAAYIARDIARALPDHDVSLGVTGTYGVEPRGIESLSGASIAGVSGISKPVLCQRCLRRAAPRNIPRNISDPERRGPTPGAKASAWALTYALEGLLGRADHRANGGPPPRAGAALATAKAVAVAGPVPPPMGARDAG